MKERGRSLLHCLQGLPQYCSISESGPIPLGGKSLFKTNDSGCNILFLPLLYRLGEEPSTVWQNTAAARSRLGMVSMSLADYHFAIKGEIESAASKDHITKEDKATKGFIHCQ